MDWLRRTCCFIPEEGDDNVNTTDEQQRPMTPQERILLQSIRRNVRGPVKQLFQEYKSILEGYYKLGREYPNNRRVKRAVPAYVEVMKDDIELVKDWIMGAKSYNNKDLIRMRVRTATFQRALGYIRERSLEIEVEENNTANAVQESSHNHAQTAQTLPSAQYASRGYAQMPDVHRTAPSGLNQRAAATTSTSQPPDSVPSPQQTEANAEPAVSHGRPPSPDVSFPCPPPYREIDPEAPPVYTVTDGRMYSFRFSAGLLPSPAGVVYPLSPRIPTNLQPPPDLGDAPPSYEEAASTAV